MNPGSALEMAPAYREDRREALYHRLVRSGGCGFEDFDLHSCEIVVALAYTYDVLHQIGARYMAEFGLSKSTFNILMLLRHGPKQGMQLHDLGELLLVSRANITGLMNHLEQKGFVRRVVDTKDRRARFARITRRGEALLDQALPGHFKSVRALLRDLSASEKETLIALLKKTRVSAIAHSADKLSVSNRQLQEVSE